MEIKSLDGIAFDRLADAFMDAFADYDIVIDRPQLQAMMTRRGFNPELSFAAFDNGRIVSFAQLLPAVSRNGSEEHPV